jgi:hypothetical protein
MAQIDKVIAESSALIAKETVTEAVIAKEQSDAYGAEAEISQKSSGLEGRTQSTGKSLSGGEAPNRTAEVYGDMVSNKLLPGMQLAGMVGKVITEGTDSAAGLGGKTFDKDIKSALRKPGLYKADTGASGALGKIKTPFSFPAGDKAINVAGSLGEAGKFSAKGIASSIKKAPAEFQKELSHSYAVQMASKLGLGNAIQAKHQLGARIGQAQQLGLGTSPTAMSRNAHMNLTHTAMAEGPKGPNFDKPESNDDTTSWA